MTVKEFSIFKDLCELGYQDFSPEGVRRFKRAKREHITMCEEELLEWNLQDFYEYCIYYSKIYKVA